MISLIESLSQPFGEKKKIRTIQKLPRCQLSLHRQKAGG